MRAEVHELATVLRVYAERKMPQLHVKLSQIKPRRLPPIGEEVLVHGGGTTCRGRVVGHMVLIELDPDTQDDAPIPGQLDLA